VLLVARQQRWHGGRFIVTASHVIRATESKPKEGWEDRYGYLGLKQELVVHCGDSRRLSEMLRIVDVTRPLALCAPRRHVIPDMAHLRSGP
jgi:hypothetical protein